MSHMCPHMLILAVSALCVPYVSSYALYVPYYAPYVSSYALYVPYYAPYVFYYVPYVSSYADPGCQCRYPSMVREHIFAREHILS